MIKLKALWTEKGKERREKTQRNKEMESVSGTLIPVFALSSEGERPDLFHVGPFQAGPRSHRQLILQEPEAHRWEVTWLTVSGEADQEAGEKAGLLVPVQGSAASSA